MKYFLDTEFIESFHKPLFGKRRHFIDLISIGIVCEDGREYYAISTEFNPKDADPWVKKNVISRLPYRYADVMDSPRVKRETLLWKSNKQITMDLIQFFQCARVDGRTYAPSGIEIYGYYADYDWVLFCSLFGRMIDLPHGFPMHCVDLKQMLDERVRQPLIFSKRLRFNIMDTKKHIHSFEEKLSKIKADPDYPKQENEHNALDDAKWNQSLYKFIKSL